MPSNAYTNHLVVLLEDAGELVLAHNELRPGRPRTHSRLGPLNRAIVTDCVSAWESYVEQVVLEAVEAIRPGAGIPAGNWSSLNASARSLVGRFNNPNVDQVRLLFSDALGLTDVTASWHWPRHDVARTRHLLAEVLQLRHQSAHGVNPRPVVPHIYAGRLPRFFRRLARCTDACARDFLVHTLGAANPWPP